MKESGTRLIGESKTVKFNVIKELRTMAYTEEQIHKLNQQFKGIPPEEIISWAIQSAEKPVVTTNFRPYEVAILHAVTEVSPLFRLFGAILVIIRPIPISMLRN